MRKKFPSMHILGSICFFLLLPSFFFPGSFAEEKKHGKPVLILNERSFANWGEKKTVPFASLRENFKKPHMHFAPFAFWFWDAPPKPELTANMAEEMIAHGLNPGYAHARYHYPNSSNIDNPKLPPKMWLSDIWFKSFGSVLDAAVRGKALFGYCDDYWWPSGQAGGRIIKSFPHLKAKSLKWTIYDALGGEDLMLPSSFFTVAVQLDEGEEPGSSIKKDTGVTGPKTMNAHKVKIKSSTLRIIGSGKKFSWTVPSGKWRVYSFEKYFHPGIDNGKVNYLDDRLSVEFLKIAHEPYEKKFKNYMGHVMPGVFMDHEGDYGYKLAWSEFLAEQYKKKTGRDIRLWMPLLIDEDIEGFWAKARWGWFESVSDIYANNFFGSISKWLEKRNMYCTTNLWEENLMFQASAVGDFFKVQRAVSMPGNDCLVNKALDVHDFKETQSVAEFEGRRFQSEILGAAGWEMSPILMKQAVNSVIAWGVNHIIVHGVYLNRELNEIPWPPDWFKENPFWRYLHLWTDFARRASYINSHGHLSPEVLLLNPMDSVWILSGDGAFDHEKSGKINEVPSWYGGEVHHMDKVYSDAIRKLTTARVEFLVSDRYYLRKMSVENGVLATADFRFKAVIMPPMHILPLDVGEKIVEFAKSGGKVYLLGDTPKGSTDNGMNDPHMEKLMALLKSLPSSILVRDGLETALEKENSFLRSRIIFETGAFPLIQLHRRIDGRDFFWLANNTNHAHASQLLIRGLNGPASIWDCETGDIRAIEAMQDPKGIRMNLSFKPYEAYWLVIDTDSPPQKNLSTKTSTLKKVYEHKIEFGWKARIDGEVQPPLANPVPIPENFRTGQGTKIALGSWLNLLPPRFSGFVDYMVPFQIDKGSGKTILNLGRVEHMAEVWINGKIAGERLWPPFEFDISSLSQKGDNILMVRVGNLASNNMSEAREAGLFGPVVISRWE